MIWQARTTTVTDGQEEAGLSPPRLSLLAAVGTAAALVLSLAGAQPADARPADPAAAATGRAAAEVDGAARRARPSDPIRDLRVRFRPQGGAKVTLRLRRQGIRVEAKLNGHRVTRNLNEKTTRRRVTSLTPKNGLKHGRNVLRVGADRRAGGRQVEVERFRASRKRVLADAGYDREGRPGRILLDGSRTKRPPKSDRDHRLRYSWRIVSKPEGSSPRLESAGARRPILITDHRHPGEYEVKLRAELRPKDKRGRDVRAARTAAATASASTDTASTDTVKLTTDDGESCSAVARRITCLYTGGTSVNLDELLDRYSTYGNPADASIWIQAWGGRGGLSFQSGNSPGASGYAQTFYGDLASYKARNRVATDDDAVLHHYLGSAGVTGDSGGGGSATIVANADIGAGGPAQPCIFGDSDVQGISSTTDISTWPGGCSTQTVLLIAGGGGGRGETGTGGDDEDGHSGGAGGHAIASDRTATAPGANGAAPRGWPDWEGTFGNRGFAGGANANQGGAGLDGIGGRGGQNGSGDPIVGFTNSSTEFSGGIGGQGGPHLLPPHNHWKFRAGGGGGGGGFGGGGGGAQGYYSKAKQTSTAGGGGGGGGSYALKGDALPPFTAPSTVPPTTDGNGTLSIVLDY